ncbi:MAG: divergent polysaccharide deacetylase family protein [Candidatus Krumholzibacteriia bacterium]
MSAFPFGRRRRPAARKGRRRSAPARTVLPWLAGVAIVVIVGGVGALKWAESRRGRAALLALGHERAYADVQAAVDDALAAALPGFARGPAAVPDPAQPARDCDWPAPDLGPGAAVRCRTVAVADQAAWWEVQARLQQALAPAGARVLWGERLAGTRARRGQPAAPDETTDLLRLDLGVAGRPTHTLMLHRAGRAPAVRWGGGTGDDAWAALAAGEGPVVALVIDDWGYNRSAAATRILELPVPLTLAILPGLSFSRHYALQRTELVLPADAPGGDGAALRLARAAAGSVVPVAVVTGPGKAPARRRETILHLPMEPEGYPATDPGPRALLVGMDQDQVTARLDEALAGLPGVSGVNNHMGSAATGDEALMRALMAALAGRGLLFVDSVTSARSVAYAAARSAGLPAARNRIFLDYDNEDPARIAANLARLVQSARKTGFALGIGHPHPATADVLARELPRLAAAGVRLVTVSEYLALRRAADGEG